MQIKMSIDEFLQTEFSPGSRPHRATIINRIKAGIYKGVREGRNWYILKDISTGDARADEILRKMKYGAA